MKNLVVGVVGDSSLHKKWVTEAQPDFDLFLVYYGDFGERYRADAIYYERAKGTKFIIFDQIYQKHKDLIDQYDAILVPDDDILFDAVGINKFFAMFHKYNLQVAQPAIMGWMSLPITAVRFDTILRYVNCVEIMTPCFSKSAFQVCKETFMENRTNWGIEWIWFKLLGQPKDKFAIVDDVTAIHTRPCFYGDTYHKNGNNYEIAMQEFLEVLKKHGMDGVHKTFDEIPRDFGEWMERPSENRLFPSCSAMTKLFKNNLSSNILL